MPFSENDILGMIAADEGQNLEFEREIPQRSDTAGELIAFANSSGGVLLIGVSDDGEIVGVSDPDEVMNAAANISRTNCRPSLFPIIERIDLQEKSLVVVRIDKRTGPPHENNSGQCYVRVGPTKQLASPEQRARLLQQSGLYHFDETPVLGTSLDGLNHALFFRYFEKLTGQKIEEAGVALEKILEGARIAIQIDDSTRLTVAGLLIFGNTPQAFMRQSRVTAVRFLGDEATAERLDPRELEGSLPEIISQVESYVKQYAGVYSRIDGFVRSDTPFYPPAAVREAIVNAMAHRDYSLAGIQIRVFIFDNFLEVRSPGRLPNAMTLENIRFYNHESRNPLIAQFLNRLGFMEEFGTGIPMMIRQMRAHNGTEPEFAIEGEEFVVRLRAKIITPWQAD